MHRFVALDSFRGLAALGVVVYHIHANHGLVAASWHESLRLMVDFFFVLSGFIIAAAYGDRLAGGYPVGNFLWLRIGRVWPLHAAVITTYVLVEVTLGTMGWLHNGQEAFSGNRDVPSLFASYLLVQAFTMPDRFVWSAQSWSISVEMALYVLAAFGWRWLGRRAVLVGALAALVTLASLWISPYLLWPQISAARGLGGFGLGMAAWWLWQRGTAAPARPTRRMATELELAALAAAVMVLAVDPPLLVADLVFAALVLVFAFERGAVSIVLRGRGFVFLGTVSYGVYLVHAPVLARIFGQVDRLGDRLGRPLTGPLFEHIDQLVMPAWAANLVTLVMVAASVGAGWLVHCAIEKPARDWMREMVEGPPDQPALDEPAPDDAPPAPAALA